MQTGKLVSKNNHTDNSNSDERGNHGNQKLSGNISSHGCIVNKVNYSKWQPPVELATEIFQQRKQVFV
jgi:hypothetical protein